MTTDTRSLGQRSRNTFRRRIAIGILSVQIVAGAAGSVRADSVNSPNITMNVDTNRAAATGAGAGNTSVVINTITVAETSVNEYSSGAGKAISIKVRPGFQFDPGFLVACHSATIGFNGFAVNVAATLGPTGAADETLTFNFTSGTTGGQDIIRIAGIRLRILNATGAAGPAQTTMAITTSTAGGAFTNQGIVAATINKGAAHHLAFSIQPGNNAAGSDLLPAVKMVDFGENIVTNDPRTITLAIQSNPGMAALLGTTQHTTVNGVATWIAIDDLRILVVGFGYTLRASHDGAVFLGSDTVDSAAFNITAAAPGLLIVSRQPVNTAAGADILIDVRAVDAFTNPVAGVNVTLDSAINPGGWPLLVASSLTKATGVDGVASWGAADDLRINTVITGYILSASGVGAPVQTNAFNITAASPALLRFVQQPTNVLQNAAFNPLVAVEITDEFNNRTESTATVDLTLGTAPCGGSLSGASVAAVSGLATFSSLSVNTPCNGDVLAASSANVSSSDSDSFDVTAAAGAAPCGVCGAGLTLAMIPMLLFQIVWRRRCARRR